MQVDYEALRNADPDGLYLEALAPYDYMMTPREVGEFIGQSQASRRQGYLRNGSLGGVKLGNAWRIPKRCLWSTVSLVDDGQTCCCAHSG